MLCWQTATLTVRLSFPLARDDLFRVELDIVAGDEMFYSKVITIRMDTRALTTSKLFVIALKILISYHRDMQM